MSNYKKKQTMKKIEALHEMLQDALKAGLISDASDFSRQIAQLVEDLSKQDAEEARMKALTDIVEAKAKRLKAAQEQADKNYKLSLSIYS